MRHSEISYTPAVDALKRLHAELGGKIKDNRAEAKRLADMMKHVESVLKMLRPDFNVSSIAARRRHKRHMPYKKGTGPRHIMDVLRAAAEPMTSTEVAAAVLRNNGIAEPTAADIRNARGSVHSTLRRYQGRTVDVVGEGFPVHWRLRS
jgi:hypothetical protein